jgi:hypothetical protein
MVWRAPQVANGGRVLATGAASKAGGEARADESGHVLARRDAMAAIRDDREGTTIRDGRDVRIDRSFDAADEVVARFRCHGAMVWPRWVASFVKPDLAIALIPE